VEVNEAIATVERSNYLPSLAAFGNYQFQAQKNDLRISTRDFINSAQVGLALSLNVFNGFRTAARVEQAELDVRKTEEQIALTENALKTAVQSTLTSLRRARERVEAQERTVEQAEKGYRIATTRFKTGSGTQLEVNDAQLALTTAKTNRIQAIYDYLVASADLDQLFGNRPPYLTSEIE
jgi:outer membrane protein TolC